MRNLKKLLIGTLTILVLAGSSACKTTHSYPVMQAPDQPKGIFKKEGLDRWVINRKNLIKLNQYVEQLESQNKKYRREIQIINGEN